MSISFVPGREASVDVDSTVDEARDVVTSMLRLHDPATAEFKDLEPLALRQLQDAVLDLSSVAAGYDFLRDVKHVLELLVRLDRSSLDRDVVAQAESLARLERALHVLTIRAEDAVITTSPQAAAAAILDEETGLGSAVAQADVAQLLGVTDKTLRSWLAGVTVRPSNQPRLMALAQLVRAMRTSMTAQGIALWLDSPLGRFEGQSPREVLATGDPAQLAGLVEFVRANRG